MEDDEILPCTFTGFPLRHDGKNVIVQDQHSYLKNLEEINTSAGYETFHYMRMRLSWLSNTKPDCLFDISQLVEVTKEIFEKPRDINIRHLNHAVRYAKSNAVSIHFLSLDCNSIRVIGYPASSFANNAHFSSQLGHVFFIEDDTGAVIPIPFNYYNVRRVTQSAMAGEVISLNDLFEIVVTVSEELRSLLGNSSAKANVYR